MQLQKVKFQWSLTKQCDIKKTHVSRALSCATWKSSTGLLPVPTDQSNHTGLVT